MKTVISIAISDSNSFFTEGLKQGLDQYFCARNIQVNYLYHSLGQVTADLVFTATEKGIANRLCHTQQSEDRSATLYFAIRDKADVRLLTLPCCKYEVGQVYRHEPMAVVLKRVEQALERRKLQFLSAGDCYWCDKRAFTIRENDVMHYMSQGETLTRVAQHLHLSVKTISGYKRSVMRKLHLRRNADLYRWLRSDGYCTLNLYE